MTRGTDVSDMKRSYRTATEVHLPESLTICLTKEADLKYGENPMQAAGVFKFSGSNLADLTNIRLAKSGKGGISATNFMDVARAMDGLKYFPKPSVAVMKHLIFSGFATQNGTTSLDNLYRSAKYTDARSAYGSVVVFNRPLTIDCAHALLESYVEGVAAPEYEEGAMGILETKKDLRVMQFSNLDRLPKFVGDDTQELYDIKALPTGRAIVQTPYLTSIKGIEDLVLDPMINGRFVKKDPTQEELRDMLTAWYINFGVRSNGIVFVKDGVTLAVGSGQQERVGAVEQAIVKAYQKYMDRNNIPYDPLHGIVAKDGTIVDSPLKGAVCSSDAYFPKRDCIDLMASVGISGVIQPGGSIHDEEIIEAVNENNMSMPFTLERCFAHF
jgi:phosphoribosylaminoimidazolecarboxamide formyltransferase/IMP cyclohydrolase